MTASLTFQSIPSCPVCSSKKRKTVFPVPNSSLHRCFSCDLLYLDPCLSADAMASAYESEESLKQFHNWHEGYYEYGDLSRPSQTLSEFNQALERVEKHLGDPSKRSLFDIGFGNGFFLAAAKKRGWAVDGIESSAENVKVAERKFQLKLKEGRVESLDKWDQTYDVVSLWDVVEHFSQPNEIVMKAAHLLRPGGLLLIGVPNDRSLLTYLARGLYWLSFGLLKKGIKTIYFLEHVAYYNLKTLTHLLKINGFERKDYFYSRTDLNKYQLPWLDRCQAQLILFFGRLMNLENRLVAIFQKPK